MKWSLCPLQGCVGLQVLSPCPAWMARLPMVVPPHLHRSQETPLWDPAACILLLLGPGLMSSLLATAWTALNEALCQECAEQCHKQLQGLAGRCNPPPSLVTQLPGPISSLLLTDLPHDL